MAKLQQTRNGQSFLTIPKSLTSLMKIEKGQKIILIPDFKKNEITLKFVTNEEEINED